MCTICMMTQTFDPARHPGGPETADSGALPINLNGTNMIETTDAAGDASTTYSMGISDTFSGTIGTDTDVDWIAVTLTAGNVYTFDAFGDGNSSLLGYDTDLTLYNASGTFLSYDDGSGLGFDAQLTYNVQTTGTYYIAVSSFNSTDATGSYTLAINEAIAPPPPPPSGTTGTHEELAEYLKNALQGSANEITTSSNNITVNISALSADGQQLAIWAMEAWEMVADVDFQVVTSGEMVTVDDVNAAPTPTNLGGLQAWAYLGAQGSDSNGIEMMVSQSWLDQFGTGLNSYSFQTYVHEFGHILGLNHLGPYNGSADWGIDNYFANDSWQVSVMSYFDQDENPNAAANYNLLAGGMMADILAVQDFYGAPGSNSVTAGDTTWGKNSNLGNYMDEIFAAMAGGSYTMAFTIYDQGGIDTLNLSYLSNLEAANINMGDGEFSDIGFDISIMGIAEGTILENAILGGGNDTAIGNDANNKIEGNGGNDTLSGGLGKDDLDGGNGDDHLDGGDARDKIIGGKGNDKIVGGAGNDRIEGGNGRDTIEGGIGNDRIEGGNGNDRIKGGNKNDEINGGEGNDRLKGGVGSDTINGEDGNDVLTGNGGADDFVFTPNLDNDTIKDFDLGFDEIFLDQDIWGGGLTLQQVLNTFADDSSGTVIFDFGGGNTITVNGVTSVNDIAGDVDFLV